MYKRKPLKLISILLTLCILLSALPIPTSAAREDLVLQESGENPAESTPNFPEQSAAVIAPDMEEELSSLEMELTMVSSSVRVNEGSTVTVQVNSPIEDVELTWTSANTSVATVDSAGRVTGLKAGKTTITASCTEFGSATCTVYVTLSENAVYRIRNMGVAVFLDCNGANIAADNLTNVQVESLISNGNDKLAQMWRIIYIGGGFYHIRPMHKLDYGLYLDGNDVKLKNIGTSGNTTSENANARWTIEYINGGYVFKNVGSNAKTLQPFLGSTAAGSFVNAYTYNASHQYQRWSLTKMTLPPSGILLYDAATGLPTGSDYVYVQTGHTKSLTVAVYSILTINQSVTWSCPTSSDVRVSSSGVLTGLRNGSGEITVSYTHNSVTHPVTYAAYSYTNSVRTVVKYDHGYEERYPQTQVRLRTHLDTLRELFLDRFLIYVDFVIDDEPFKSLADECPTTDIDALCTCGICQDTEVHPRPWETDTPIVDLHNRHHKNIHNILFNMEQPEDNTVHLVMIGHVTCQEADQDYHNSLADNTKGMTYRNYRIASAFNFESDAAALRTMVHEFGHLFSAPDHYNEGGVPGTESMGSDAFSRQCIYGEDKTESNVTSELLICDGCKAIIAYNAEQYTPWN